MDASGCLRRGDNNGAWSPTAPTLRDRTIPPRGRNTARAQQMPGFLARCSASWDRTRTTWREHVAAEARAQQRRRKKGRVGGQTGGRNRRPATTTTTTTLLRPASPRDGGGAKKAVAAKHRRSSSSSTPPDTAVATEVGRALTEAYGPGMGRALATGLADLVRGGHVTLQRRPGGGARVGFVLPAARRRRSPKSPSQVGKPEASHLWRRLWRSRRLSPCLERPARPPGDARAVPGRGACWPSLAVAASSVATVGTARCRAASLPVCQQTFVHRMQEALGLHVVVDLLAVVDSKCTRRRHAHGQAGTRRLRTLATGLVARAGLYRRLVGVVPTGLPRGRRPGRQPPRRALVGLGGRRRRTGAGDFANGLVAVGAAIKARVA